MRYPLTKLAGELAGRHGPGQRRPLAGPLSPVTVLSLGFGGGVQCLAGTVGNRIDGRRAGFELGEAGEKTTVRTERSAMSA